MKEVICRVKGWMHGLLVLVAKAYGPREGIKPEDWWRFYGDYPC